MSGIIELVSRSTSVFHDESKHKLDNILNVLCAALDCCCTPDRGETAVCHALNLRSTRAAPMGDSDDTVVNRKFKLHHRDQNEERMGAMAMYGNKLLIRKNNAVKVALLGQKLVKRRNMGFAHDSRGSLNIVRKLTELRYKTEFDENELQKIEKIAIKLRYTGSASFLGSSFGNPADSDAA